MPRTPHRSSRPDARRPCRRPLAPLHSAVVCAALLAVAPWTGAACAGGDTQEPSHTDRMAAEHAGDHPVAGAAADVEEPPASEVVTERVVYATVGGKEVTGYLARPAGSAGGHPGVIVIHEWWGLNDNVETMARMLAHEGYAALAVDLYGGEAAGDPEGARALMQKVMDDPAPAKDNLRQAHAYLTRKLGAPRTGVIGWCFGGGWSLQTALLLPELDAAVMYYGRVVTDQDELRALRAPLLGLFGAEDQGIPVDGVRAMEAALGELGKDVTIVVYPGAGHAFANPSGTRYQADAAKDAWAKTTAFFAEHLEGSG
jgi:carboxymethylenebutenolidase